MFITFKPTNEVLKKYIDYYYVDIKHDNTLTVYDCFLELLPLGGHKS